MSQTIKKAQEELEQAWQNFNYAEKGYEEVAILQVQRCMEHLRNLLKEEDEKRRGEANEGNVSAGR